MPSALQEKAWRRQRGPSKRKQHDTADGDGTALGPQGRGLIRRDSPQGLQGGRMDQSGDCGAALAHSTWQREPSGCNAARAHVLQGGCMGVAGVLIEPACCTGGLRHLPWHEVHVRPAAPHAAESPPSPFVQARGLRIEPGQLVSAKARLHLSQGASGPPWQSGLLTGTRAQQRHSRLRQQLLCLQGSPLTCCLSF